MGLVAFGVAGQPQAKHLPGEGLAGHLRLDLAQAAALAQNQVAEAPLLGSLVSPAMAAGR